MAFDMSIEDKYRREDRNLIAAATAMIGMVVLVLALALVGGEARHFAYALFFGAGVCFGVAGYLHKR